MAVVPSIGSTWHSSPASWLPPGAGAGARHACRGLAEARSNRRLVRSPRTSCSIPYQRVGRGGSTHTVTATATLAEPEICWELVAAYAASGAQSDQHANPAARAFLKMLGHEEDEDTATAA
jgi:hypothetical protein